MLPGLLARLVVLLGAAALALGTAASAPAGPVHAVAATTPPMGLNSWNAVGCSAAFDEAWVRAQADALVRTGLRDAGYRDVDLDDCWAAPERDTGGRLVADPARFPHGVAALADYVHARGLRLGVYTSAGTMTCDAAGFPGSLGHETARPDPETGDGRLVLRRPLADGSVAVSVTALGDRPVTVPADVAGTDLLTGAAVVPGGPVAAHATVLVRTAAGA
ncbi:hypothetical protein Acsp06_45930 [Actinomycetospora sp. NBRC 106375]|uniref:glycoside hydrolase family 27 protein n=1 Tax=Actinomycetospora sp. NBRC 106375 TaxID=3032207 RepID=UPI00249FE7EE|nr:glycoside hydrolase family 27 protein [Actinomycetospora sp. NBRC 106375]GLZ48408.1 hypothetical protein Acsp06_45930 [Actinomycetospora sp. NBRC 106375]